MKNYSYQKTAFLFRRDLRLEDNQGLLHALEQSATVLPVFIFDPRQIDTEQNPYFSAPAFSFMLQSLHELDEALRHRGSRLYIYTGAPEEIVSSLITNDGVDAVMVNKDYTPFARTRDKAINDTCATHNTSFSRHDDLTLSDIETIRTDQDTLYTIFTPFMKKARQSAVNTPHKNNFTNYYTGDTATRTIALESFTANSAPQQIVSGGRSEALTILGHNQYLDRYSDTRNLPAVHGTSRLSAHHKFGTISIRETYHMVRESGGNHEAFLSELYWRDFYYYIGYHFPLVFKQSFLPWAKYIEWNNDKQQFAAWCAGETGVPMVDAGMRELNATGWIHNRSRMIVASYLTKNLLIDWRWGEQYFATKLVDYDPAQNNGGWQWSASTGADPKPIRIFNPYTQATKYDPTAAYIKQWVPALADTADTVLTDGKTQNFSTLTPDYPAPLIDQKESYHRARTVYKKAKQTHAEHTHQ